MNRQVEVTCRTLRTVAHDLMVHARVLELIVDAYSKTPKLYGMENITTAEVMDKLDMFQSRFRKIDQFGWWDLERISADAGT